MIVYVHETLDSPAKKVGNYKLFILSDSHIGAYIFATHTVIINSHNYVYEKLCCINTH